MISIKHSWLSHVQKIGLLLLLGAIIPVFTGLDTFWLAYPYDESRALQMVALAVLSVVALLSVGFGEEAHRPPFAFSPASRRTLVVLGGVLTPGFLLTLAGAPVPVYSLSDAGLWLILTAGAIGGYMAMRANPRFAAALSGVAALLPLLCVLRLFHSLWVVRHGGQPEDWQPNFANMRIYDSAVLASLFLLWARPGWLSRPVWRWPVVVISGLYLMSLLVDGARSVLLGMAIGVGGVALMQRERWREWGGQAAALVLGGLLFALVSNGLHASADTLVSGGDLVRQDDSGRLPLWSKAWMIWHNHPLTGIGGGIFGAALPAGPLMHPHNLPLMLISEWGVTGMTLLVLMGIVARQLWVHRRTVPPMLLAGVAAIAVDSLFSGNMVYPTTQLLCLWTGALALAHTPLADQGENRYGWQVAGKTVVLLLAVTGILALTVQHAGDLRCVGCISKDDFGSPRFWQFGRAIHLTPDPSRAAP